MPKKPASPHTVVPYAMPNAVRTPVARSRSKAVRVVTTKLALGATAVANHNSAMVTRTVPATRQLNLEPQMNADERRSVRVFSRVRANECDLAG